MISPGRPKTISLARILQIAASVVLLSALAFAGIRITGTRSDKAPRSGIAVKQLPDGSVVSLNAGSKVTYARGFGTSHRNLALKGEAYFEVEKNAIPFIITAGKAVVKVTGTTFNVKAYTAAPVIRVTVTEGMVSLYDSEEPAKTARLKAGETGVYHKSLKTVNLLSNADLNDLAWKTRIIDFRNTPLSEVAEILANTYHVSVDTDPSLRNCSVTVRFEDQDLITIIEVLKSTLDLNIIRKGRHISISGKGC
jgi:ferric-dicitrate binding protein FerR (iron transport regulator)